MVGVEQARYNTNKNHLESIASRMMHNKQIGHMMMAQQEQRTSSGNIIALACGPLLRQRYINPKIEAELVDFKKEIEDKFAKSKIKNFKFPLKKVAKLPEPMRN